MPQGSKILIVEDEMIISMEIKQKLRGMGYQVVGQAITGESAIQKAGETEPDLVLMDIRLKGEMDGISAAKRIMELYDLPVIFLTAHSDKATLERAIAVSPSGYLLKPFKDRELMTNIEMSLHKHRIKKKVRDETYPEGQSDLAKSIHFIHEPAVIASTSGYIEAMNPAAIQITGFQTEELTGRHISVLFGKQQEITDDSGQNHKRERDGFILPDQVVLKQKDGKNLPITVSTGFIQGDTEQDTKHLFLLEPSGFSESTTDLSPNTIKHLMAITAVLTLPAFVIDKRMQLAGHNSFFSDLARKAGISQYMLNRPLYETPKFSFFGDMQDLQEIFRSGETSRAIRKYTLDESVKFIEFTRVPLKREGTTTHIVSIMTDITTERIAIYEAEKMKKINSNVFSVLDKIRSISVEIRSPIQEIARCVIENRTADIPTLYDSAEQVNSLINELDVAWIQYSDLKDQFRIPMDFKKK